MSLLTNGFKTLENVRDVKRQGMDVPIGKTRTRGSREPLTRDRDVPAIAEPKKSVDTQMSSNNL